MWLVDVSIRRPVFATMLIGTLVVLGLVSFGRLGVDLFPRVEFPYVAVTTTLEGAAPDTIETEVSDVLEEQLNTISGIRQLRSESAEGLSQVFIEFELGEDADIKAQEVRDKVNMAMRDLPVDADPPVVEKVDPDAAPILSVMLSGDRPVHEITTYADEVIKEALQRLPGVGSVSLVGGRKRQMRVWLDSDRMRAYSITAEDVAEALRAGNAELPGGRLEVAGRTRELGARTLAEVHTPQDFAALVVTHRPNGAATRVGDVARVEDGVEDEHSYAQLNGRPGVALEVRRQSGRNTVEVARAVRAEVDRLATKAPAGIEVVVARDTSRFIEASISDVMVDLAIAILLVVAVTFLFLLSWRATLIVALAIPTSLVATFLAFGAFDFTLNTMTLLALTVAIGLLVDDAIVVAEAIQRDIDTGLDARIAAAAATRRVALAVLAGTFATLAVFVPIAFMEGIVGRFFFQYGLAIVFSVSVSLLVALTLTPMLASRLLRPGDHGKTWLQAIERHHHRTENGYAKLVAWAMRRRFMVLGGAILSIIIGGWIASQVPTTFMSNTDRSEFLLSIKLPLGTGMAEAQTAARRVDAALRAVPDVTLAFVTVSAGSRQRSNLIDVYVGLTPKSERDRHQEHAMDNARAVLARAVPEATEIAAAEVPWVSGGGIGQSAIELVVKGSELTATEAYAARLVGLMRGDSHYADVRSSYEGGRPELQVRVDRQKATDLGVSPRGLAATTQALIGGIKAGNFEDRGRRYDVRVRLEEGQRQSPDQIARLQTRGAGGRLVEVGQVAKVGVASGPAQIDRQDRARKVSVLANAATGVALGQAVERVDKLLADIPPPNGIEVGIEGQARRLAETGQAIAFAALLAMVALYIVLASQFDSFGQPVLIMLTAPLSFSGAFATLWVADQEMSLFAQIGLLALLGIVMKNGILLVDRANQLRAEGADRMTAMARAAPERLRPVLMTALAAIFGLVPVAFATSDGAEWRNAMGFLMIGGLTTSTLLTLMVVPAAYMLPDNIGALKARIGFGWLQRLRPG
jgi:HAE1 family hydrophobic/amphiphilic exporter-1